MSFFENSGMQIQSLRGLRCNFCAFPRQVPVTGAHAIEGEHFAATARGFRFRAEIELDRFPRVSSLRLQSQSRCRLVTAMHHAIFASAIASDPVYDSITLPFKFFEQLRIARVVPVGH